MENKIINAVAYWKQEVVYQLENYDDRFIAEELAGDNEFVDSIIEDILNDDCFWGKFNDIVDCHVNMATAEKKEEK